VIGIIAVFVFVSQLILIRNHNQRLALEHRSRALLDAIPDSMLRISGSGEVLQVRAVRDDALYPHLAGLEGRRLPETDDPRFPVALSWVREVLKSGSSITMRRPVGTPPGQVDAEIRIHPSARGEAIIIIRDTSGEPLAKESLQRTERLAALGTVMAGVAHDINNPLSFVLLGLAEAEHELGALGADHPREVAEIQSTLAEVRSGAEQVQLITAGLCVQSESRAQDFSPVDVHEALKSALRFVRSDSQGKVALVKDLGDCPMVLANPSALSQVFLSLLLNAIQAFPDRSPSENILRIRTRASSNADRVIVDVIDNGLGIPKQYSEKVFDPFFTTKPPGEGTGLGLFISRKALNGFGGELVIDSQEGLGTTVRVVLLAANSCATEPDRPVHEASTPALRPQPSLAEDAVPGRVLVIDDEAAVCRSLARILRGHDVTLSQDASRALDLCRTQPFDLIFCDLMMPGTDGVAFYDSLHTTHPNQASGVVFMTGGVFSNAAAEFVEKLENPVINKPFDIGALRSLVRDRLADRVR